MQIAADCRTLSTRQGLTLHNDADSTVNLGMVAAAIVAEGRRRGLWPKDYKPDFTPCRHLRPSSGREHTIVTYSVW